MEEDRIPPELIKAEFKEEENDLHVKSQVYDLTWQRHPLGEVKKSKLCGTAPDYKGKMCGKVRKIFTCNYAAIFSKFVLELCGFPKRARLLTYFSFYIRKS